MTRPNDATLAQLDAADPGRSTWLSANAGSGKTRVLTDRVARLLLKDVPPERILCLTYTKAAASEMQNRLFKRLGEWAMLADDTLAEKLDELGIDPNENTPAIRRQARTLFARAIETPGGLKIQTIHSFCSALLRRFPLEAGVSPQFTEMDDRAATLAREDVLEQMSDGADADLVDDIARYLGGDGAEKLLDEIARSADGFAHDEAEIAKALDLPADAGDDFAVNIAFDGSEPELFARLVPILKTQSSTYQAMADRLSAVNVQAPTRADLDLLAAEFLYQSNSKDGAYRIFDSKSRNFPLSNHKKAVAAVEPVVTELHALMDRVAKAKQALLAIAARDMSLALHRFARRFLELYEARKLERGWLDFDDLIGRARELLTDPRVAQWVLFRLDGGIDHILVDEAQDTSPRQWDVIRLLASEFTAGEGARQDTERTIFVVGDKKQSIYSFQGADPEGFDRMQSHFQERLTRIGKPFGVRELLFSFRSAVPVLRTVDDVFMRLRGMGLGGEPNHKAFHADMPGRVDLWPMVEAVKSEEDRKWYDPVDKLGEGDHQVILARRIAAWIKARIGTPLPDREKGARAITAGDFLILVQRRSPLFHEIIRACKSEDLPIAGADRLKIGGELAVKDISALLSFLATPEDDLSLACALRSPLFGISEQTLYTLAHGRGKTYLWQAVRNSEALPQHMLDMLADLRDQADFLRPYDLIERILTRHGGRQKLVGRLGAEAEDGIDALLNQALTYEAGEVPSLTGFLGWLTGGETEIKRQADSAGDRIRVMSVHGAKGLESPIVILPDTAQRKASFKDTLLRAPGGIALWKTSDPDSPPPIRAMVAREKELITEERMRLLYVAMTRAEQWLVVCGGGVAGDRPEDSWHNAISEGLAHEWAERTDEDGFEITRYQIGNWPMSVTTTDMPAATQTPALPDWSHRHAPTPDVTERLISPSDLGGAKALPGEGDPEDVAKARGTVIHRLLEVLPGLPRDSWETTAETFVKTLSGPRTPSDPRALAGEAMGVLDAGELAHLFAQGTLAEVPVTAPLPTLGGKQAYGIMDRLIVTKNGVIVVDFKTNRVVPDTPDEVPEGVLRQMGAYAEMLGQVFPDHRVTTAILWTYRALLMPLPSQAVDAALRRAATS
ncbi:MAG: double-strand break repair helicase AddA [Brevirhabdus sp.]